MRNDRFKSYRESEAVPTSQVLQHPTKPGVFYPVHRRPLRRTDVDYTHPQLVCFVTFNVMNGWGKPFTGVAGQTAWDALQEEIGRIGCRVHAACLMPDHAHLLVSPSGEGESVSDIVRRVKTRCSAALRHECQIAIRWQTSFYDHVLRESEKVEDAFAAIVYYIRNNPARAGLGDDYPYLS